MVIAAPKRLAVLGATGSVGTSTLDLVARHPGRFSVDVVTAHSDVAKLAAIATRFGAKHAAVADPACYRDLKSALAGSGIGVSAGAAALVEAAARPVDCTVAAIVGVAGLEPALAAVTAGRRIALANKECLVAAGDIFTRKVRDVGAELLPVDSEHAGVFQALAGQDQAGVASITLTASGGPFRTWGAAAIAAATPADALKHPNWSMGRKITIDSATLMNKGLELIEAHHLFAMPAEKLGVVVHPQSIVHALVSFMDGSVLAQLANPDMRTPIAMALSWPRRMAAPTPPLDLAQIATLTFEQPDPARFPALGLAIAAMKRGGLAPAALNAANEVAVAAFLDGRIPFPRIAATVDAALNRLERAGELGVPQSLEGVLAVGHTAALVASECMST